MSVLEDLVKSIKKTKSSPRATRTVARQRPRPPQKKTQYVRKSGDGGVIMDFGGVSDLHPSFQAYENLLNRHSDPTQVQTANYHKNAFEKALDSYVELGEDDYEREVGIEERKSFEKSRENVAKSEFKKTTAKVGRETVTAQSETDAAVLAMFKNNELE